MVPFTQSSDRGRRWRNSASAILFAAGLGLFPWSAAYGDIVIGVGTSVSGAAAWEGEQHLRGVEAAVEAINAGGGVLGERLRLLIGDDACSDVQALAVAHQMVSDDVAFVSGHLCSHASIAAAAVYDRADVVMISPASTNPLLTEQGRPNVFRVCGRDDGQGLIAAAYLADAWPDGTIALVHDGTLFGEGLALEIRRSLSARNVSADLFLGLPEAHVDYRNFASSLVTADVDVVHVAGYIRDVALLVRELAAQGSTAQVVGAELVGDEFWLISGEAANGIRFTFSPDHRVNANARDVVDRFRSDGFDPAGFTLQAYATVEAWAQAVEIAGTPDPETVMTVLESETFETVLGTIGFDEKGDVTGIEVHSWYVWRDGQYYPMR